jgi:hypothetical protein
MGITDDATVSEIGGPEGAHYAYLVLISGPHAVHGDFSKTAPQSISSSLGKADTHLVVREFICMELAAWQNRR